MVFGGVAIGEIGYAADLPAAARVYALGGDPVGMFKSIDGGLTWTELTGHGLTEGTTMDVLSVAGGNDVIYALDADALEVAKSTDGGATWAMTTSPGVGVLPASVTIVDADTVYVAGSDGIKKTTNGGTSWSTWGTGDDYPYLSAAKGGSKVWLGSLATPSQKYRYASGHTGQETLSHTVSMDTVRAVSDTFAFVVTGNGDTVDALYKISGTTVTDITPGAADPLNWIDAWSPDGGTTIIARLNEYFGSGSAMYKSTTGGTAWSLVAVDAALKVNANFVGPWLTVDPNDATKWWAIGQAVSDVDSTVWYSTDTGDTWTPVVVASGQIQLRSICAASG